jgi:hypothetical protein
MLLWRRVLQATIDTLRGESRGQYDIRLARPDGIDEFFEGLPREATELGGYTLQVPLEPVASPIAVPALSIEVAYIGPQSARDDWRVPSQRPDTAYPLWRDGVGIVDSTQPGEDFVVLVRDPEGRFHARWLRQADVASLPSRISELLTGPSTAGVERLDPEEWDGVVAVLGVSPVKLVSGELPRAIADTAGVPYRPDDESVSVPQPDPFKVDPDVLDRGILGHRRTQNALAEYLAESDLIPLSHRPNVDPAFDVAWRDQGVLYVAEVKSITDANEEKQLRLALGQVLRYSHQLRTGGDHVVPVIVAEREPSDKTWTSLCEALGVRIAWTGAFDRLIAEP